MDNKYCVASPVGVHERRGAAPDRVARYAAGRLLSRLRSSCEPERDVERVRLAQNEPRALARRCLAPAVREELVRQLVPALIRDLGAHRRRPLCEAAAAQLRPEKVPHGRQHAALGGRHRLGRERALAAATDSVADEKVSARIASVASAAAAARQRQRRLDQLRQRVHALDRTRVLQRLDELPRATGDEVGPLAQRVLVPGAQLDDDVVVVPHHELGRCEELVPHRGAAQPLRLHLVHDLLAARELFLQDAQRRRVHVDRRVDGREARRDDRHDVTPVVEVPLRRPLRARLELGRLVRFGDQHRRRPAPGREDREEAVDDGRDRGLREHLAHECDEDQPHDAQARAERAAVRDELQDQRRHPRHGQRADRGRIHAHEHLVAVDRHVLGHDRLRVPREEEVDADAVELEREDRHRGLLHRHDLAHARRVVPQEFEERAEEQLGRDEAREERHDVEVRVGEPDLEVPAAPEQQRRGGLLLRPERAAEPVVDQALHLVDRQVLCAQLVGRRKLRDGVEALDQAVCIPEVVLARRPDVHRPHDRPHARGDESGGGTGQLVVRPLGRGWGEPSDSPFASMPLRRGEAAPDAFFEPRPDPPLFALEYKAAGGAALRSVMCFLGLLLSGRGEEVPASSVLRRPSGERLRELQLSESCSVLEPLERRSHTA
ncbi:hypothetical protein PybrP1_001436 [[Pythium] brassicae (nom. inval.)]|nr:hypothetical protein PybrP1_001436 [[Pythium] brassicae (nom. inval.)]